MPDRSISEGKFFWKDERDKMFIFFLLRWKCLRTQKSIYKTNTMSCIVFFLTFLQGCHLKLRYIFFYMCMWFFLLFVFCSFVGFFFPVKSDLLCYHYSCVLIATGYSATRAIAVIYKPFFFPVSELSYTGEECLCI